jgi:hypothetical protein
LEEKEDQKMKYLRVLAVFCVLALFAVPASALTINALEESNWDDECYWYGTETSQSSIDAIIEPYLGTATEQYKADVASATKPQEETGPLAGSYETTFSPEPTEPNNALIQYVGGAYLADPRFALVKDGTDGWYLFDLGSDCFDWNGMDDLKFLNFFPQSGQAISHVALYGGAAQVPEPATMLLLGFGLIGLAVVGRKNFRK